VSQRRRSDAEFKAELEPLAELLVDTCIAADGTCDVILSLVALEIASRSLRTHADRGLAMQPDSMRQEFEKELARHRACLYEKGVS
jgi:hypothetical protein